MLTNLSRLPLHPYETLSLSTAGYVLGGLLVLGHLFALLAPEPCKKFLRQSARDEALGSFTLAIALFWFFLLIAPAGGGIMSSLRVDLPGFEGLRPILQIATPVAFFLMVIYVKEFLFVRALGVLGLLFVAPFLAAAFLKEPETRLLIPVWSYVVIGFCLFWIGKPYLFRDQVNWVTARPSRWNALCWGGLLYGAAILVCDFLYW